MANIIIVDEDNMESCEPDSTMDVEGVAEVVVVREQTPLQEMNRQLVERQHMCAIMVATSIRERNRVRSELEEAWKQRESMMADLSLLLKLRDTASRSCMNIKVSVEAAINKRLALLKEIEREKMWRPPSAEMNLKKQQELRERVEHMRAILGIGRIRTPDD